MPKRSEPVDVLLFGVHVSFDVIDDQEWKYDSFLVPLGSCSYLLGAQLSWSAAVMAADGYAAARDPAKDSAARKLAEKLELR